MQHRDQPRSNVSLTGSVISPLHFYDQFKLARDITLAQVPHPQFRFLLSGFACAIALAEHSELDKEDDEIRELLVKKPISSHDLVVESLIIPTFPINPEERRRYSHSLEQIGLGYWREVCEALRIPESHEITWHSSSQDERNLRRRVDVRYLEPLALSISPSDIHVVQLSLPTLLSNLINPNVPKSAIFYATQLHRLRELGRQYDIIELALKERPDQPRVNDFTTCDLQVVANEIYRVLLSSALYSTAMFGSLNGAERLGFSANVWIETYEMGDRHGSEVFGTREAIRLNGEFLRGRQAELEEWDGRAVEWWCPGSLQQDVYDRNLLLTALEEMETNLLAIFEEIHMIQNPHSRQTRAHSATPPHDPYSPIQR